MPVHTQHPVSITVILGPTASGKSALALEHARQYSQAVIINADALQLYKDLPILSAQPDANAKATVPHVLYGFLSHDAVASAALWRDWAVRAIEDAIAAGQHPIITGGTGFYLKALMEGLSPMPDIPDAIRANTIALQQELGNPAFHAALAVRDPVMAARLHPNHTARLVRAWEVLEATGRSLAEFQAQPKHTPPEHWRFEVETIMPPRSELLARITQRFTMMIDNGALDEVQAFNARILTGEIAPDAPPTRALGYTELSDYLSDKCTLNEATERAIIATRQYAKRQVTWLRNQIRA